MYTLRIKNWSLWYLVQPQPHSENQGPHACMTRIKVTGAQYSLVLVSRISLGVLKVRVPMHACNEKQSLHVCVPRIKVNGAQLWPHMVPRISPHVLIHARTTRKSSLLCVLIIKVSGLLGWQGFTDTWYWWEARSCTTRHAGPMPLPWASGEGDALCDTEICSRNVWSLGVPASSVVVAGLCSKWL